MSRCTASEPREGANGPAHYITEREAQAQQLATQDWSLRAACATAPIGLTQKGELTDGTSQADRTRAFFYATEVPRMSVLGAPRSRHEQRLRQLCGVCPVLFECRQYGRFEPHGFLGGQSEVERSGGKKVR